MTRFLNHPFRLVLISAAAVGLALAQPPANPPSQPTPWRRVGDPPPRPPAVVPPQAPVAQAQDPSEPVDRSDQFGQPAQDNQQAPPPQPDQQMPAPRPNDRPAFSRQAYGLPSEVTLQPGTFVTIRTNQPLSSDHNQPGDTFSGTLVQPVVVDGVVVAQRGQNVYGRVAEAQKAHSDKSSRLGLELTSLTLADGTQASIRSQLVARQGSRTPAGDQAGTIVGTTAVGAAIGAAADWGRGAAIGGGVGAAAGIIGVLLTRNHPTIVYPETPLTFQIVAPVTVAVARAPQAFRYVGPDEYDHGYSTQLQPRPQPIAPRPYYYGPSYYPYYPYYWGPSISLGWYGGFGGRYYGRGGYRRWR